jgi:hypothetical protein
MQSLPLDEDSMTPDGSGFVLFNTDEFGFKVLGTLPTAPHFWFRTVAV